MINTKCFIYLVFTYDNFSLQPEKQTHSQVKRIPSLFESDSESEIDGFQIKYSKKSNQLFLYY